jgi:hypothetical protein
MLLSYQWLAFARITQLSKDKPAAEDTQRLANAKLKKHWCVICFEVLALGTTNVAFIALLCCFEVFVLLGLIYFKHTPAHMQQKQIRNNRLQTHQHILPICLICKGQG